MADEFYDILVPCQKSPHATERLGKGAHHEISSIRHFHVVGTSFALRTDHPESVGLVDVEFGAKLIGYSHQFWQARNITRHAENTIDYYHFARFPRQARQPPTQ